MTWILTEKTLVGIKNHPHFVLNTFVILSMYAFYIFGKTFIVNQPTPEALQTNYLVNETTISVQSSFEQKIIKETEVIPFEINYQDDSEMEYGEEKVLQEGVDGAEITNYLVTYWFGDETSRDIESTETIQPQAQLTARGTKIVWREIETDIGKLKYWRKLHVWATKYDGNCEGCRGLTYSGTLVRKGVCAVDPKVIPLGTNFYVEGYGMCRSEDIGGGIKGNEVDLGYEDVTKGDWRTGFTNVYLLTSAPE